MISEPSSLQIEQTLTEITTCITRLPDEYGPEHVLEVIDSVIRERNGLRNDESIPYTCIQNTIGHWGDHEIGSHLYMFYALVRERCRKRGNTYNITLEKNLLLKRICYHWENIIKK